MSLQFKEAGVFSQYKNLLKPRLEFRLSPQGHALHGMKMSSVRNTIVTCTLCRGQRYTMLRSADDTMRMSRCMNCKGSGIVDQNQDWGQN